MSSNTNSTSTSKSKSASLQGINVKDAMSILSSRSKGPGEKSALVAASPELKKLGQTLDLMNSQTWTQGGASGPDCCTTGNGDGEATAVQDAKTEGEEAKSDKQTSSKFQLELSKKTPQQLLSALFELQKKRVEVYSQFNSGLDSVLLSGNLGTYPNLTANVTASFAVISNSIRDIQTLLEKGSADETKEAIGFIQQLQILEKEKLNLTAALHLEKIREQNEKLERENDEDEEGDDRILSLLTQGVRGLQDKIGNCVENINDVLEELRYAAHDMA